MVMSEVVTTRIHSTNEKGVSIHCLLAGLSKFNNTTREALNKTFVACRVAVNGQRLTK
jgi:hypothetical protein